MSLASPETIRSLQRKLYVKAKEEPSYRFYSLYDKIYRQDILRHAYSLAKAKGGAPGVDGETFEKIEEGGSAAMLAGVPMGEGPIGGDCSVTTVVISDHGKGDRPDGKLGSKSPCRLGGNLVRSARGTSNSTGRSESEPVKP